MSRAGSSSSSSSRRRRPPQAAAAPAAARRPRGVARTPPTTHRLRHLLALLLRRRLWVALGLLGVALVVVFDLETIGSPAMLPGLEPGDLVLVDRLGAELTSPDA